MFMRIIMLLSIAASFVGCSTIDPLTMEYTGRDMEVYEPSEPIPVKQGREKVFIVSKVIAHQRARENRHDSFLMKAIEASTSQYFSNLGWFRTIDHKNGLSVDASKTLDETSDLGEKGVFPVGADYVLVIESSMAFIAKQGWKRTLHSKKARGVQVESNFRLIDIKLKEMVFGMKFRSTVECDKGDIRTAISDAADLNAGKFARIVSARYLSPGRVTETRGSGRCARVTIGKNYMLNVKTGLQPATRVDFFAYERDKNSSNRRFEKVVVAHGTVISSDKNEAWVEVDADWIDKTTHLATYNVKKGHYVKISEESIENEAEVK